MIDLPVFLAAANSSIDLCVFPSSLWPDSELLKYHCPKIGSTRCIGATNTSVLLDLYCKQMDSRSPILECRNLGYLVIKVQKMSLYIITSESHTTFSAKTWKKLKFSRFSKNGSEMAVNWQCFAISLAFHICYDIHAPSSATVLLSNFHIFLLSHFGIRGGIIFYKKELQFWEVIHIPTLNRLYDNDAATVLSEISMYPGILEEQLLRLHPEKEEQTINILRYLQRCIRRSPAAAGAVVNGSSAVTAAAVWDSWITPHNSGIRNSGNTLF